MIAKSSWKGSHAPVPMHGAADLWWPGEKPGKCDLCERTSVPTDRCTTEDGTTANLCVICWAWQVDAWQFEETV